MKTTRERRAGSGFTLVELLVVIVIIAVLAALLLTAIAAAQRFVSRTKARMEVAALDTALHKYYTEYRRWFDVAALGSSVMNAESEAVKVSGDVAKMLQGEDIGGQNPKKMKFMQFQTFADPNTGMPSPNGDPVTPWAKQDGTPVPDDCFYWFKLDVNFDNTVNGTGDPLAPPENAIRRSVITWTWDKIENRIIGSWQ